MSDQQQAPPPQEKNAAEAAEHAKDPNHPAHPEHKDHGKWLKNVPKQFGSAAIFGAGATAGSQAIKGALGQ